MQTLVLEPARLRSTADDEVLHANAAHVSKHVSEMAQEAPLAWAQAAIKEDSSKGESSVATDKNDVCERGGPATRLWTGAPLRL